MVHKHIYKVNKKKKNERVSSSTQHLHILYTQLPTKKFPWQAWSFDGFVYWNWTRYFIGDIIEKMFKLKYGHNFTDGHSENGFLATATSILQ